jgi:hypothetical protein
MTKTPRDWLLARHADATEPLDALRRNALPPARSTLRDALHELFHPHRTAWRVLAVAWVALALFHLTTGRRALPPASSVPSAEAVAAWIAQFQSHETLVQVDRPH